jgi:hypothetical protein
VIAYRYSTIIYWTKLPCVSHFLKKSDFHLSNGVFPIFCYEISATALAGIFCVARGTCVERVTQKFRLSRCLFPLCISLLCAQDKGTQQSDICLFYLINMIVHLLVFWSFYMHIFMWFSALIFIYSYKIQRAIRWQIEANSKLFSSVFPL